MPVPRMLITKSRQKTPRLRHCCCFCEGEAAAERTCGETRRDRAKPSRNVNTTPTSRSVGLRCPQNLVMTLLWMPNPTVIRAAIICCPMQQTISRSSGTGNDGSLIWSLRSKICPGSNTLLTMIYNFAVVFFSADVA